MKTKSSTRTQSIAFCGLTVALLAVSAWITIPFGPIPFTLQVFVMVFALIALSPKQCMVSLAVYLAIGALGLPVFSAMRGGIGVIMGPTGGFLWGYLVGAALALLVMQILGRRTDALSAAEGRVTIQGASSLGKAKGVSRRDIAVSFIGAAVFIVIMYLCGWIQLMAVSGMGPGAAFATAVAPFIIVDVIKTVLGVFTARAVKRAIR